MTSNSEIGGHEVVLGPSDIRAITNALETLFPWLNRSSHRLNQDGSLEFDNDEPVEAISMLRFSVERFLPTAVQTHLGERSGLGWPVFFGHVVAWWLPQRGRTGFLRAFVDRAALHLADSSSQRERPRLVVVSRHILVHDGLLTVSQAHKRAQVRLLLVVI